jgi:lipopolysaccharide biosynthesis protein
MATNLKNGVLQRLRVVKRSMSRLSRKLSPHSLLTSLASKKSIGLSEESWADTVLHEDGASCKGARICIFAHFDQESLVRDYVVYYLSALKFEGFEIVFISTAERMEPAELEKIKEITCKRIIRKNIGYDFGSWKTGIQFIENYQNCEQLVFANDSVIGPVNSICEMFDHMSDSDFDIWGVTDSYEIDYHVQSYFICFTKRVLQDGFLDKYAEMIQVEEAKQDVIDKYEVGLSQLALKLGYSMGAYCPYADIEAGLLNGQQSELRKVCASRKVNPTLWFIDELLNVFKVPFIKKELLIVNPHSIDLNGCVDYLKRGSGYPVEILGDVVELDSG